MRDEVIERCRAIRGVEIGEAAFSAGPALWVGTREIAHFDGDGALDIRLTKQVIRGRRAELAGDERVSFRSRSSDWLEIRVATADDVEVAVALVTDAVAANLPTAQPGPTPTGADLSRRRRFH